MKLEELKALVGPDAAEYYGETALKVALEFCRRLKLEPVKAVSPGLDVGWDEYPELLDLPSESANLTAGGVRAYHSPRVVELYESDGRMGWYLYLLEN